MAEGKRKWTSVFQTGGNRFIIRNERRADVASIPTKVEGAADYANLIVTAVNTYPAVEGLVKALEDSRAAIASLHDYALGGVAVDHTDGSGPAYQYPVRDELLSNIDSALSRFRSLQNGGAE